MTGQLQEHRRIVEEKTRDYGWYIPWGREYTQPYTYRGKGSTESLAEEIREATRQRYARLDKLEDEIRKAREELSREEIRLLENLDFQLTPVGYFKEGASPYGLYDMAGNVGEWVADWYDSNYYQYGPKENPQGPERGENRVLRGGSWLSRIDDVRCAARHFDKPEATGFPEDPQPLVELSDLKEAISKGSMGWMATKKLIEWMEKNINYYGFRCTKDAPAK
jgi:hypothetical protein